MFAQLVRRQTPRLLRTTAVAASHRAAGTPLLALPHRFAALRALSTTPSWRNEVVTEENEVVPTKTSENPPGTRLYIGNVAFEATEEEVHSVFAPYGQVEDVHLNRSSDGYPRGFGYVTFHTLEDAQKAFMAVVSLHERPLRIDYATSKQIRREAPPGNTLYISNLPFDFPDDTELRTQLTSFGPLSHLRYGVDAEGRFRGFCHAQYRNEEDAHAAHEAFTRNGLRLGVRRIGVSFAAPSEFPRKQTIHRRVPGGAAVSGPRSI
ncbi:Nucleolar protein gar2 [Mycena chlorophos]|uniref:Nucleolar protein gar2 n=1 Tax=Mycena chlorophos TaxID=658473 RepID=A0A8H6SJL1_MYCCL|nr:Nucleolar protein gar2 [Mycena chlorophos]